MELSINTVFEESEKGYFDCIEAYDDKGNMLHQKSERNFVRNFLVIWECVLESYNFIFMKQFANTIFVESGNCYLGAHWGLW